MIETLKALGLTKGDTVLVHSDIRAFRLDLPKEKILPYYLETLLSVIGEEGTLAVPAYFYEYAREGIPFDVDHSPVSASLGLFSQFVTAEQGSIRSCNPLQSLCALGKHAHELAGGLSLSGYGVNSPWHKLRKMGGKILFLGAPLQSMTFVHYIEQHFGVPHLYFKLYPYPVIKNGQRVPGNPISAVRYLEYNVEYDLSLFESRLMKKNLLHQDPTGLVKIVTAEDAYKIGLEGLNETPYFFLKQPPKFILGKIPTDTL